MNAFNGANFDHYAIYKEFVRRNIKPDKYIVNNGSIVKFEYRNIRLFDICKHLTGSLKENLESFKCNVIKGDFDHNDDRLKGGWESMPFELQNKCIKYLKADVLGLKELYEKLNNSIHEKYHVNLTDYISTSSLTFNLWKEHYTAKKDLEPDWDFILLPTLEEEQAFRQSVRGGRTYKSKHRFISKQYQGFKDGDIKFEDIDDYIVDADVVSLYPTAMAKYEYPIGLCKKLGENEKIMKGKMGIYNISYITFDRRKAGCGWGFKVGFKGWWWVVYFH